MKNKPVFLFYDVETNGLPDYRSPIQAKHQPHIVQMGAILTDSEFNELERLDVIVKPNGWTIPKQVSDIHGITEERAMREGIPEHEMLYRFAEMVEKATERIAFNDKFDALLVSILIERFGYNEMQARWQKFPVTCAMEIARPKCNIPPTDKMRAAGYTGPKNPKLEEAVKILMGETMEGAHAAIVDVEYTVRLYKHMIQAPLNQ